MNALEAIYDFIAATPKDLPRFDTLIGDEVRVTATWFFGHLGDVYLMAQECGDEEPMVHWSTPLGRFDAGEGIPYMPLYEMVREFSRNAAPCPFCGVIPNVSAGLKMLHPVRVECKSCGCTGPGGSDFGDAVRRWNIRK